MKHNTFISKFNKILDDDEKFMHLALEQANLALNSNEIPIGAIIVLDNKVIASGYNLSITNNDPTAHAEIIAIRNACQQLNNYRLSQATLYVTVEPCPMCSGAILQARFKRIVYGCKEPKTGSLGSRFNLFTDYPMNIFPQIVGGILEEQCNKLLIDFFNSKRNK